MDPILADVRPHLPLSVSAVEADPDGIRLGGDGSVEVISEFPYGEWIFSVRTPTDPDQPPVFDLSGPVE